MGTQTATPATLFCPRCERAYKIMLCDAHGLALTGGTKAAGQDAVVTLERTTLSMAEAECGSCYFRSRLEHFFNHDLGAMRPAYKALAAEARARDLPQRFQADLFHHDRTHLALYPCTAFLWLLHPSHTHLWTNNDPREAIRFLEPWALAPDDEGSLWYHWNGHALERLADGPDAYALMRRWAEEAGAAPRVVPSGAGRC